MLFCRLEYDRHFFDAAGNRYIKVSGLRRKNAIRILSVEGDREQKEAFFSATTQITRPHELDFGD